MSGKVVAVVTTSAVTTDECQVEPDFAGRRPDHRPLLPWIAVGHLPAGLYTLIFLDDQGYTVGRARFAKE